MKRRTRRSARRMSWSVLSAAGALTSASWGAAAAALAPGPHVVLDGSLGASGPVQPLTSRYSIDASSGKVVGPNLFHSFTRLDLDKGETAAFTGPSTVHNVLARVTGGSASSIDGTIEVDIPKANFYLINPAGVVFGPDAAVQTTGSFIVTTADVVKLADGAQFAAMPGPSDAALTTAAPAAFGFLQPRSATIAINGSKLTVAGGQVTLVANGVRVGADAAGGAKALVQAGGLSLVATASPSTVSLDTTGAVTAAAASLAGINQAGTVEVSGGSVLKADAPGGGNVTVACGTLSIHDLGSEIVSHTSGPAAAGALPGAITINAHAVTLDSGASKAVPTLAITGIEALTDGTDATAKAAGIDVHCDTLAVSNGATILSHSSGAASAGNVSVDAATSILLQNNLVQGNEDDRGIVSRADEAMNPNGSFNSKGTTGSPGNAGDITVTTASLAILQHAAIASTTGEKGNAGNITVNVSGPILIDAQQSTFVTGIRSDTRFRPTVAIGAHNVTNGNTGNIKVTADSLTIDGGYIRATSSGDGGLGEIDVNVTHDLVIESHAGVTRDGEIENGADTGNSTADGGVINVTADSLTLTRDALIVAPGQGSDPAARGGTINVTIAHDILIDHTGGKQLGGIQANSRPSNAGQGKPGQVTVESVGGSITLTGGASINSDAIGNSDDVGAVSVKAHGDISLTNSTIEATVTTGPAGRAGAVDIQAGGSLTLTNQSEIRATGGTGPGGNVSVTVAGNVTLDGSGADPQAPRFTGISTDTGFDSSGKPVNVKDSKGNVVPATGDAGTLTITAGGDIQVLNGASINSNAASTGSAGSVVVMATGNILLQGSGLPAQFNQSSGKAEISAVSQQAGSAGSVTVQAGRDVNVNADGLVTTTAAGAGNAGNVTVTGRDVLVATGGAVASNATGGGTGGNVQIEAQRRVLVGGGGASSTPGIAANSSGAGSAGDVSVTAGRGLILADGSLVSTSAPQAPGGNVRLVSKRGNVVLSGAEVDTSALQNGNILLGAPGEVLVRHSTLRAAAQESSGPAGAGAGGRARHTDGEIAIGVNPAHVSIGGKAASPSAQPVPVPQLVLLESGSTLDGTVGGGKQGGVPVTINSVNYLKSPGSSILSDNVTVPVEVDVAAGLVGLDVTLAPPRARLEETCSHLVMGRAVSSFVVQGRGSEPVEPGAWLPEIGE